MQGTKSRHLEPFDLACTTSTIARAFCELFLFHLVEEVEGLLGCVVYLLCFVELILGATDPGRILLLPPRLAIHH